MKEHEWTDANSSRWRVDLHGVWFFTRTGGWELVHPSVAIGTEFLRALDRAKELEGQLETANKAVAVLTSKSFEYQEKIYWARSCCSIARDFDLEGKEPKCYLDAVQEVFEMERGEGP